jgi:predicted porin
VTMTAWTDTDFTLAGDYYHYQQDPAAVGYYSVAFVGRSANFGNGVPIAPLRFSVRPEVLHRFGAFSVKLWVTAGHYVSGTGESTTGLGAKLQYKFTKKFRLWVTATGQRDIDQNGNPTRSGGLAMGAGYRF